MIAGAGRLWGKVKNVESLQSARKLQEEADIPQKCFELLEIVGELRQGRMDATSQETLDMRMFGEDGDQVLW